MCYASPAPRCSTHALADMKKAQVALDQASVNLEKARLVGKTTQTALREAKLRNAEAELEVAKATYDVAFRAYEKAKEEKAAAYKFFKAEEKEYHLSTKGIEELRAEGKGELADRFAAERKYRVAKAKAKKAKEEAAEQQEALASLKTANKALEEADRNLLRAGGYYGQAKETGVEVDKTKKDYDKASEEQAKAYMAYKKAMNDYVKMPGGIQKTSNQAEQAKEQRVDGKTAKQAMQEHAATLETVQVLRRQNNWHEATVVLAERNRMYELLKVQEGENAHHSLDATTREHVENIQEKGANAWSNFAHNGDTHPAILSAMLQHNVAPTNNAHIAGNISTCTADLAKLYREEGSKDNRWSEEIRSKIAENPNCPVELLQKFSKDEDEFLRRRVARNSSTPNEILATLRFDKMDGVRLGVAQHRNTKVAVLREIIANDGYPMGWLDMPRTSSYVGRGNDVYRAAEINLKSRSK